MGGVEPERASDDQSDALVETFQSRVGESEPDRGEDPVAVFADGAAGLDERVEPRALPGMANNPTCPCGMASAMVVVVSEARGPSESTIARGPGASGCRPPKVTVCPACAHFLPIVPPMLPYPKTARFMIDFLKRSRGSAKSPRYGVDILHGAQYTAGSTDTRLGSCIRPQPRNPMRPLPSG